jgi:hypothetical protein
MLHALAICLEVIVFVLAFLSYRLEVIGFVLEFASYPYWNTDEPRAAAMLIIGASLFVIGAWFNIRSRGKRCWRCKRTL